MTVAGEVYRENFESLAEVLSNNRAPAIKMLERNGFPAPSPNRTTIALARLNEHFGDVHTEGQACKFEKRCVLPYSYTRCTRSSASFSPLPRVPNDRYREKYSNDGICTSGIAHSRPCSWGLGNDRGYLKPKAEMVPRFCYLAWLLSTFPAFSACTAMSNTRGGTE